MSNRLIELQKEMADIFRECLIDDIVIIGGDDLMLSSNGLYYLAQKIGNVELPEKCNDYDFYITDVKLNEIHAIEFDSESDMEFAREKLECNIDCVITKFDIDMAIESCLNSGIDGCSSFFVCENSSEAAKDADDIASEIEYAIDTHCLH